jgi:hypothetical protein
MRCGKCKQESPTMTAESVKRCYNGEDVHSSLADEKFTNGFHEAKVNANPPTDPQIKYILGLQDERDTSTNPHWMDWTRDTLLTLDRSEANVIINSLKALPRKSTGRRDWTMPEGRYAIRTNESPDWQFYQVDKPSEGRWAGYVFVKQLIGSPGDYRKINVKDAGRRNAILARIEADPQRAMLDYGLHSGVCGKCSSPLTNADSLARGIGPICAGKMGW